MSAEDPGHFAREQLWRGALHAWLAFMTLMLTTLLWLLVMPPLLSDEPAAFSVFTVVVLSAIFMFYAAAIGGVVSLAVVLLGIPLAALLALSLRHVRGLAWHVTAFGAFGAGIGLIVAGVWTVASQPQLRGDAVTAISVCLCALATGYGRWRASRAPRRPRQRPLAGSDTDADADAESRLWALSD